jgi:phosphoribosyl-ATP pyrophosphohydrolase
MSSTLAIGEEMMFFNELEKKILERQKTQRTNSYTQKLLTEDFLVERKVSEECFEVIEAAFKKEKNALVYEACDLIYHLMVLLRKYDISLNEIEEELRRRER